MNAAVTMGTGDASGAIDESGDPKDAAGFELVANVSDVPAGTLLAVQRANGQEICLYNHAGVIGAVSNECTHAEFAMSDGTLRRDGTIECAWHGARFACATGRVCRGPAEDPLPVYQVRVEAGRVYVGARVDE